MARPKRLSPVNTFMHVFTKFNPELRLSTYFLEGIRSIIRESKIRFKIDISNYYIHNNHLHLETYIKEGRDFTISKYMQWLLTKIAVYVNRKLKRHGKVFYDRFKSKIISTYRYFENLARYIIFNSEKHSGVRPEKWPYSSYHFYVLGQKDDIVTHYQELLY